mmetsp:Transcript_21182/g.31354  ORF Transcript_21182/g.31354 Transcript_21182/m.31354 type:complete len:503 (-) Transcript_21182:36-1544(-)
MWNFLFAAVDLFNVAPFVRASTGTGTGTGGDSNTNTNGDTYKMYDPSLVEHRHCVVARKGRFFAFDFVTESGDPMGVDSLEWNLEKCVQMADDADANDNANANANANTHANTNPNATNMYARPSVASSSFNEFSEDDHLRHYAYSKANADMKQQYAAASAPDMGRKRNGTSDDGTNMQSYTTDRYFPQGVQSTSFNEFEPLSFTNPRRTVARRLSAASVATSSVHDHIAHSIASKEYAHDQAIGHSVASSSAHELCQNTAALTFYTGVRKTIPLPLYSHYGIAMTNANVARSDYSNQSDSFSKFSFGSSVNSFAALSVNSYAGAQPDELQSRFEGNAPTADHARNDVKAGKANTEDHPINDYGDYRGSPVVRSSDQRNATKFSFAVLSEVECCEFGAKDVTGKRVGLPEGFKGLACRHCKGSRRLGGRLFPSKIKTMADTNKTLMPLFKHMMKCTAVSQATKTRLEVCKADHDNERKNQKKYGSQKAFFTSIWDRLHGEKEK